MIRLRGDILVAEPSLPRMVSGFPSAIVGQLLGDALRVILETVAPENPMQQLRQIGQFVEIGKEHALGIFLPV